MLQSTLVLENLPNLWQKYKPVSRFLTDLTSITGCVRQNENPTGFKIVKEPLLVQKQTLHQQKALDLCYLEPEGQVCSLKKVT